MKAPLGIQTSDRLRLNGADITVSSMQSDGSIEFVVDKEGRRETVSALDFISAYSNADLVLYKPNTHPADFQPLVRSGTPDEATRKAQVRLFYTQAYDRNPCALSTKALESFIASLENECPVSHSKPSAGSLRRWVKSRGALCRRELSSMRDRQSRGPVGSRLHAEAENIIQSRISDHYRDLRRRPITTCKLIWDAIASENELRLQEGRKPLPQPSESTIRRRILAARTKEQVASKFGRHIAKQSFEPLRGRVTAARPLERVVIDHTVLDIHLIDPDTGNVWGRPTLCLMIDVYSRGILGFVLSPRHPSRETLIGLLRQAVRPKTALLQQHEVQGQWLMCGLPLVMVIDNGKEGVSKDFLKACTEQSIEVEIAPVGTPEWKGIVERLFRTINGFFDQLPGGVPGTAEQMRQLRFSPDSDACFTLANAEQLLTDWIVNIYHEREHPALSGLSPRRAWESGQDFVSQRLVSDLDQFDSSFGELEERKLSRKGILIDGLIYTGPALANLLQDLLPTVTTRKACPDSVTVQVRVMPDDIGSVKVLNPVRQKYEELKCEALGYARGMSREMHRRTREEVRRSKGDTTSHIELARTFSRLLHEADALSQGRKRAPRREAIRRKSAAAALNGAENALKSGYSAEKPESGKSLVERGLNATDFDLND